MQAREAERRRVRRRRRCARRFRALVGEHLESRTLLALTLQPVGDLNLGPAGIFVHGPIVEMGGFAYFSGGYATGDYELWKSDGTTTGTTLLKDINPGNGGSSP